MSDDAVYGADTNDTPAVANVHLAFNVRPGRGECRTADGSLLKVLVYRGICEVEVLADALAAFQAGERISPRHVELLEILLFDADAFTADPLNVPPYRVATSF